MIITDTPGVALEKIALDIFGPFPETKKGNIYVLTMQDVFSKFSMAAPLPNQLTATIADAFVKRYVSIFGSPKYILTDRGANFMSTLMRDVSKRFRIQNCNFTAYHHQTVGSLERSHVLLAEYIKQYTNKNKGDWDDYLELAMFSFNTSVHSGTNYTPYELVFGSEARLPSQRPLAQHEQLPTYQDYLKNLIIRLTQIRKFAHDNLVESKIKSKNHYDKNARPIDLKVGDSVFLELGPKPHKFDDRRIGKCKVLEILPNENVRIQCDKNTQVVHANRLSLF